MIQYRARQETHRKTTAMLNANSRCTTHGLFADDLFQAVVRGDDALDAVGRFGALDLRNLQEVGQRIRFGLDEEVLLPLVLVDPRQIRHDLRRQEFLIFCVEVEISHSNSSFGVQFHQIPFNDAITVYP